MDEPYTIVKSWLIALLALLFSGAIVLADGPADRNEPTEPGEPGGHVHDLPAKPANANPAAVEPSPLVDQVLDDPTLTDRELVELMIFHGRWDSPSLISADLTPTQKAQLALLKGDYWNKALQHDDLPVDIRAKARLLAGDLEQVVTLYAETPADDLTVADRYILAQAYLGLAKLDKAHEVLAPIRDQVIDVRTQGPDQVVAAARGLVLLARLEGRPSQDYHMAMNLLGRSRLDDSPLHYPTHIAEADLLFAKGNRADAGKAYLEALSLNPKAAGAWFGLGMLSVTGYDFDRANKAIEQLEQINADHPLARELQVRSLLRQKLPEEAMQVIDELLVFNPKHRDWLALKAAAYGLLFDTEATEASLAKIDKLAPGTANGLYEVGSVLSVARQYAWAAKMLKRAIEREPNWPEPHVELGLLMMQWGDLPESATVLERATAMDPFHVRAANQLKLVRELLEYETIDTGPFVIRYQDGIDEVLARDMAERLGDIYQTITTRFDHVPNAKTQIDILPDKEHFAVRITGAPDIWTIAASTGDVIALTPPRLGAKQRGPFDWFNVIGHEYVHTVTLSKTHNRIEHWLTEACAVLSETTGRTYQQATLLASAYQDDALFALDEINWGFIRPKTPRDRPLAYAQSAWMLEYLIEAHGRDAMLQLLKLQSKGIDDDKAIEQITGASADAFFDAFHAWAGKQIDAWGLGEYPASDRLKEVLANKGPIATDEELFLLLAEHPLHPGLLKLMAQRALAGTDREAAVEAVQMYREARPIDPWADRALVSLAMEAAEESDAGFDQAAIDALRRLDKLDNRMGDWAFQLASVLRKRGEYAHAYDAIMRSLQREPYNGTYRELAATIALQAGNTDRAVRHLQAMPKLEPDRAIHYLRLAAIYQKLERFDDALASAKRAKELDERVDISRFVP